MIMLRKFFLERFLLNWFVGPLTAMATTVILGLLLASQWGYVWHFLYGDEVSFAGWNIPVPKDFYVDERGAKLTLWKTVLGTPVFSDSYGLITLIVLKKPIDYEADFGKFQAIQTTLARENGVFGEANKKNFPLTPPRYCVEFLDGQKENALSQCIIDGARLTVWYSGSTAYLPAFYDTVRGLSRIPPEQDSSPTNP